MARYRVFSNAYGIFRMSMVLFRIVLVFFVCFGMFSYFWACFRNFWYVFVVFGVFSYFGKFGPNQKKIPFMKLPDVL